MQLGLRLAPKLVYAAEGFLLHQGVKSLFDDVVGQATSSNFSTALVQGDARSGKTHLSIALVEAISQRGIFSRLIESAELPSWLASRPSGREFDPGEVIVVDDAHLYLNTVTSGYSGPFVTLVEGLRRAQGSLILLSSQCQEDLPCDEHVMSRLSAGSHHRIGLPSEDEMIELLMRMAHQRGIALNAHKARFVVRRTGREVAALERYFDRVLQLVQTLGRSVKFDLLSDAVETADKTHQI